VAEPMKNILITLLLGATLVFAALYVQERQRVSATTASVNELQQKFAKLQSAADSQERRTASLRQELEKARTETSAKIQQAAKQNKKSQASSESGASETGTSRMGKAIAGMADEMSKNPELKDMIKNQQKMALSAMTDKNYAKLFSQLNLTGEQSAALKELIIGKQLVAAQAGISMFGDDMTAEKRAEIVKEIKAGSDDVDAKIKDYLGDAKYSDFQAYEKALPQRMVVSGFKDQLASGANGLSDAQENDLMKAMEQERTGFKFTTDFSDKSKFNTGDYMSMFTEDKVNTFMQELGQLNSQYVARAQSILSADQLTSFQKYLDGQTAMQKVGMQMAAKMFGSKNK
jgi:hypothetical protein